jgi:hypothetical protein
MRRLRWGAAVLAAAIVIPYCTQLHQARQLRPDSEMKAAHSRSTVASPDVGAMSTNSTPVTATRLTATPNTATHAAGSAPGDGEGRSTLPTLPPPTSDDWTHGKFADFTRDELADMTARCELRWQLPPFGTDGSGEGDAYDRVLAAERDRYAAAVRALYVELTGDADGAARMSLRALADAIRADSDDDAIATIATHRRLAERRAGDEVPASGSVYERYLALQLDAGDAFERALAAEVGRARAHELRLAAGPKFTLTGCDPEHTLFRSQR